MSGSNTLGQPNFTPSNATGRSGVNPSQIGHLGKGVLGTIEESPSAFSAEAFYFPKGVAQYNLPSSQRSHGNQNRSMTTKTFGSRGTITLPRRDFKYGYSFFHFSYPQNWAFSGPDTMLRGALATSTEAGSVYVPPSSVSDAQKYASVLVGNVLSGREIPSCSSLLPTHFWSGGVGYAFFNNVELNMGGAGQETIDRYTNWMLIMASAPTTKIREELMIMAGGGYANCQGTFEEEGFSKPYTFGWFQDYQVCGFKSSELIDLDSPQSVVGPRYLPQTLHSLVPIKTPDFSLWNALMGRKPFDTSILAGDMQYTFTFANFYEFTDTGTGKPNFPLFTKAVADDPEIIDDFTDGSFPVNTYTIGAPGPVDQAFFTTRVEANPIIWTNHYRVCDFSLKKGIYNAILSAKTQPTWYDTTNTLNADKKTYPNSFNEIEYINSDLILTNPTISARGALLQAPGSAVFYPYQYGFQQTYHIPSNRNPYGGILRYKKIFQPVVNGAAGGSKGDILSRINDQVNNIVQLIQMPANPTTTMLIGCFREKDRRYLGKNTPNSYSPVLFWNALEMTYATLYDGGNILFQYNSPCDFKFFSMSDRIGSLRIPFRGGLCQLHPDNANNASMTIASSITGLASYNANSGAEVIPGSNDAEAGLLGYGDYMNGKTRSQRWLGWHSTEVYESHIYEIPFVFKSLWSTGEVPQQTPSFSKTQLRFEFRINPFLKPFRGYDDMYDITYGVGKYFEDVLYGVVNGATDGEVNAGEIDEVSWGWPIPDCWRPISVDKGVNAYSTRETDGFNSTDTQPMIPVLGSINPSSWNVNNGALMLVVVFLQNQIWQISPLQSKLLGSRG